jgi:predicted patatin/cPLA2 family phospholipase
MSKKINDKINDKIDEEINKIIGKTKDKNIKDTLILSGGGSAGILYAGVFKALDELHILKNIKTIIGVSAGTLYSFMYLLGYTVKEIEKFAETFDGKKLTSIKNLENLSFDKILIEYGLDNGESFKKVFSKIVKQKKINPNITLLEFYKLNKIKFIICVTNIDMLKEEYFSFDSTPNIKVFDAIRATISIPLYFTPHKINDKLYIDGGCMNNFPINHPEININNTIAIMISNPINKSLNNNFINYLLNILKSMSLGWRYCLTRGFNDKCIIIDSEVNNIFNFGIDIKERKRLIKLGYDSIINSNLNHHH